MELKEAGNILHGYMGYYCIVGFATPGKADYFKIYSSREVPQGIKKEIEQKIPGFKVQWHNIGKRRRIVLSSVLHRLFRVRHRWKSVSLLLYFKNEGPHGGATSVRVRKPWDEHSLTARWLERRAHIKTHPPRLQNRCMRQSRTSREQGATR